MSPRKFAVIQSGKVHNVILAEADLAVLVGATECPEWVSPGDVCDREGFRPAPSAEPEEPPPTAREHVCLIVAAGLVPVVEAAVRKALDAAEIAWQTTDDKGGSGTALVALAPVDGLSNAQREALFGSVVKRGERAML